MQWIETVYTMERPINSSLITPPPSTKPRIETHLKDFLFQPSIRFTPPPFYYAAQGALKTGFGAVNIPMI